MVGQRLIIGCGYLGRQVAEAWRQEGHHVWALTRHRAEELAAAGLTPIIGDVLDPASLVGLPPVDTVLYAVGLDRSTGRSMREVYVDGLKNVLANLPDSRRFLYISSTGCYGQTDGSWVTEASPTEPEQPSGQVVLAAEQALRERRPEAIILRFAGIYGPGRLLRKAALLQGEPFVGDADKWLNLIHLADGVQAVLKAEQAQTSERLFNISDGTPVTRRDFYTELARLLNAPAARFERPASEPAPEPNRRISPDLARQELGFAPEYPSYLAGLAASLDS